MKNNEGFFLNINQSMSFTYLRGAKCKIFVLQIVENFDIGFFSSSRYSRNKGQYLPYL